ncbi:hypothetical protein Tco_0926597 [Tanacetum coccineum]|uniref:Uncharacterized protein n=1 Tax=Tanacetum coccineum TaxID=301880 RepID=A0ABQ5DD18_9ASTR
MPINAAFQTNDLDAFDSDCDEAPRAQEILMANLSNYDSDVISEVPNSDNYQNNVVSDMCVQDESYSEQLMSVFDAISDQVAKCTADNLKHKEVDASLTTELERYKERNRSALKQEINSLKQTLSKQIKEKESLLQTLTVFKKESKEKENKYMDKEIDLEKKTKELDNIVYKKAQRIKPTLYYDSVISKKHDVISVIDEEETLIELNEMKMVFNQMEAAVEQCSVDKKYVMNIVMHADYVPVNVLSDNHKFHICVNSLATLTNCAKIEQDYIDEYSKNLVLKAELAKKEQMVEKKFFDEVVLRCSRLENRNANLELKLQHQKESFLNNRPLNNQNALEILEFSK